MPTLGETEGQPHSSWADRVERDQEGYIDEDLAAGLKHHAIIEERDGKRYRIVKTYKIVKEMVPLTVMRRRSWKKFGEAADNEMFTKQYQEVRMEFGQSGSAGTEDREEGEGMGESVEAVPVQTLFKCQHCRGPHYSMKCPYIGMLKEIKHSQNQGPGAPAAAAASGASAPSGPAPGGAPGAYVVPGRRAGAAAPTSSMFPGREELPTLRISNLTDSAADEDLRELIQKIDSTIHIKRVHIPKDFDKKKSRGFAYITFEDSRDAERCLRVLNGMKYDHLLLHAEWAKK